MKRVVILTDLRQSMIPDLYRCAAEAAGVEVEIEVPERVTCMTLSQQVEKMIKEEGVDQILPGWPWWQHVHICSVMKSDAAEITGQANVITLNKGHIVAIHDTRPMAINRALPQSLRGRLARAVVIGNAYHGRSAVIPCRNWRQMQTFLANENGVGIDDLGVQGVRLDELAGFQYDLIINATAYGHAGEYERVAPCSFECHRGDATALELLYGQETPFMRDAVRAGATVITGKMPAMYRVHGAFLQLFPQVEFPQERYFEMALKAFDRHRTKK